MNIKSFVTVVSGVLVALAVSSCTTAKVESWTGSGFEGRPIGDVMVIGVTTSGAMRRQFEDIFVHELGEVGVKAVAGYTLMPQDKLLTRDEINAAIKKASVNSVIVTKVADVKDKVEVVRPVIYSTPYDCYRMSYLPMGTPGYAYNYAEIYLEMNLYDAVTQKLVWTGRSKVTDNSSEKSNMNRVVKGIIKNLKKQGMITPKK